MSAEPFDALWIPAWYGSDQSIRVGQIEDFLFFKDTVKWLDWDPPPGFSILFNMDRPSSGLCTSRRCQVLNIKHVQLGQLIGVEVESLYCVFELISGEHIYVDSEEHPGEAYDPPLPEITDWSLTVKMLPIT